MTSVLYRSPQGLRRLPDDILDEIFKQLDLPAAMRLARATKYLFVHFNTRTFLIRVTFSNSLGTSSRVTLFAAARAARLQSSLKFVNGKKPLSFVIAHANRTLAKVITAEYSTCMWSGVRQELAELCGLDFDNGTVRLALDLGQAARELEVRFSLTTKDRLTAKHSRLTDKEAQDFHCALFNIATIVIAWGRPRMWSDLAYEPPNNSFHTEARALAQLRASARKYHELLEGLTRQMCEHIVALLQWFETEDLGVKDIAGHLRDNNCVFRETIVEFAAGYHTSPTKLPNPGTMKYNAGYIKQFFIELVKIDRLPQPTKDDDVHLGLAHASTTASTFTTNTTRDAEERFFLVPQPAMVGTGDHCVRHGPAATYDTIFKNVEGQLQHARAARLWNVQNWRSLTVRDLQVRHMADFFPDLLARNKVERSQLECYLFFPSSPIATQQVLIEANVDKDSKRKVPDSYLLPKFVPPEMGTPLASLLADLLDLDQRVATTGKDKDQHFCTKLQQDGFASVTQNDWLCSDCVCELFKKRLVVWWALEKRKGEAIGLPTKADCWFGYECKKLEPSKHLDHMVQYNHACTNTRAELKLALMKQRAEEKERKAHSARPRVDSTPGEDATTIDTAMSAPDQGATPQPVGSAQPST